MEDRKRTVFVFDDINYRSGARTSAFLQMQYLSKYMEVCAFSLSRPESNVIAELRNIKVIGEEAWEDTETLLLPFFEVIKGDFSLKRKIRRLCVTLQRRVIGKSKIESKMLNQYKRLLERFDTICVISESSKMRDVVSELKNPKKIQWIHTNYFQWSNFSEWSKSVCKCDAKRYEKFDTIVTLSEKNRRDFLKVHPSFAEKTVAIGNLMPIEKIMQKSMEECGEIDRNKFSILSVGRLEKEKAYPRIIRICRRLMKEGFDFNWYVIGSGSLEAELKKMVKEEKVESIVHFLGFRENSYPYIKRCDLFALLSEYEGQPLTVYESLILGTPVIASDVGGISEQLEDGKLGILVENDEEEMYMELRDILSNSMSLNKNSFDFYKMNRINESKLERLILGKGEL